MAAYNKRKVLLLILRRRRLARRAKRCWIKKINRSRLLKGEYHSLIQEMRLSDHESFYKYFRMTPQRFDHLLSLVGPLISHQETKFRAPVSASERLAVTLRYLATGDSMQTIAFSYRLGHSTVCNIIDHTCDKIWDGLSKKYLQSPSSETDWKKISDGFRKAWNFPNCVGSIDGKHVVIQAPPKGGSAYYNYKNAHSIVLMAVCDSQYCFTLVDIGDFGRHSDGGVFANSNFGKGVESNSIGLPDPQSLPGSPINSKFPYVFVGDAAFPLKTNILRPYPGRFLEEHRQIFNYRLSRARRVIENTFGIMAAKFRIFRRPIIAGPDKVTKITKAACCLHNYLKISDIRSSSTAHQYCPPSYVDHEDPHGNFISGDWRLETSQNAGLDIISRVGSNTYSRSAAHVRDMFKDYFLSPEGEVEWQYRHVRM